ncbi:pyocin activator PrtN family protein [Acinetobacter sp. ANC 4805]|uniref:pyocin activator PrtN family protein n=1 Tax=Acinetobacter sp. ANC 4805 TaxID=2923425 RepID=UPI001F4AB9EF|nr:pyocin activator PrtN family protein [Acinetobacter sp. ANC 4805]MCH7310520.1 pyocin activator PrtN family protein [Acinetobacter sp. ANC 4805]
MYELKTIDYLFLKYRTPHIKLEDITKEFYPHLCKERVLEKARQQKFPFACFRLDDSQKAPFFVRIEELANAFDEIYRQSHSIFQNTMQKTIKTT